MDTSQAAEFFRGLVLRHRGRTGLTQLELAARIGASRRTIQDWEGGLNHPSAALLQALIAVLLEAGGLTVGREAAEARELWAAVLRESARMRTPIDGVWLAKLLRERAAPPPTTEPARNVTPVTPAIGVAQAGGAERRQDWGDAPDVLDFVGRGDELETVRDWVLQQRCQLVAVLGMGGIGKTSIAAKLADDVAPAFQRAYWRGLRNAPRLSDWLADAIGFLSGQQLVLPAGEAGRLAALLELLRERPSLLVLDNFETLLEPGQHEGRYREGFGGYGALLRAIGETRHQSCLVLTSREAPPELAFIANHIVRTLELGGLGTAEGEILLAHKQLSGTPDDWANLIGRFGGNGLALKMVGESIHQLFGGDIGTFLDESGPGTAFRGIRRMLAEQIERSSGHEQSVLRILAVEREPMNIAELMGELSTRAGRGDVLEAVEALRRRSLVERSQTTGATAFTLQSVVLEYVTDRLVEEVCDEIAAGRPKQLVAQPLIKALAQDYVRDTQERLIGAPVLQQLRAEHGDDGAKQLLLALLEDWRDHRPEEQGYGPGNVVNLLRLLSGDLRALDLSRLSLRSVFLQGVQMQDARLSGALIHESVFTQAFDASWAVAISRDRQYWAAGSKRGEVRVWQQTGQTLLWILQAHTDIVPSIAFSPDGRTLASGSYDGSIKLWEVASGALLWTGWHTDSVYSVAFASDGSLVASGGNDTTVRLWDSKTGAHLQTLPHPDPVYTISWSPVAPLLASGGLSGQIRLWQVDERQTATSLPTLVAHTNWVVGLAFAPDGGTLASGSHDGTVRLWEIVNGSLRQTLTGHTDRVLCVTWSPDGRTIASGGRDQTIWLWDVAQGITRAALRGHTAEVYNLAFTPDSGNLLSGSDDGTLRLWDTATGHCVRVVHGYAVSIFDLDWSPDGSQLATAASDSLVSVWQTDAGAPPMLLRGHQWIVQGVAWSPDGRLVASCGWDNAVRLWDPATGAGVEVISDTDDPTYFFGLAWSPDGERLASGTYMHGVMVWAVSAHRRSWIGRDLPTWIRGVAWSPDSTRLVGAGDDGHVYLWDASDGTLLRQLSGHRGVVTRVAWHSDGKWLASGGGGRDGGELFVWDVQSGERVRAFAAAEGVISAVTWYPNRQTLISGGSDGTLRWWDVNSGQSVRVQKGHEGTIRSLKVSPDGSRVASCGDDGALALWSLDTGEHLRTLRRDRPYERVEITGIGGLTEAQKATLRALGALEDAGVTNSRQVP
jgi:WD40 repeat protein/transcriptional regulator with XRE-family HTH domain